MGEVNLLDLYPKAKRDLDGRIRTVTEEDRRLAKQFGKEYFDGPRNQGYGGYRYDGRWKPIVKRFKDHYNLTKESSILDVGCAKGFMLHDFLEGIPEIKVAGIDVSQYAIDNAMESVKPFIKVGNAKKLDFPDNSFDLVISINTVHNLKYDECCKAIQEIERVSRKHSFIVGDAYRTEEEKERLLKWNLTAETFMSTDEWKELFQKLGYTGDYYWFIP